jgi:hypothetical protein
VSKSVQITIRSPRVARGWDGVSGPEALEENARWVSQEE